MRLFPREGCCGSAQNGFLEATASLAIGVVRGHHHVGEPAHAMRGEGCSAAATERRGRGLMGRHVEGKTERAKVGAGG